MIDERSYLFHFRFQAITYYWYAKAQGYAAKKPKYIAAGNWNNCWIVERDFMKHRDWMDVGKVNGWRMTKTNFFYRLLIIRHIRAITKLIAVELWYSIGPGSYCGVRSGYDSWVLYGIWHGLDKDD